MFAVAIASAAASTAVALATGAIGVVTGAIGAIGGVLGIGGAAGAPVAGTIGGTAATGGAVAAAGSPFLVMGAAPGTTALATGAIASTALPVAAAAGGIGTLGAVGLLAGGIGVGTAAIMQAQAQSAAVRAGERQAGEYYNVTRQQMALQAQENQIVTLANVIAQQRSTGPTVYTTGPATIEKRTAIEELNWKIHQILGKAA